MYLALTSDLHIVHLAHLSVLTHYSSQSSSDALTSDLHIVNLAHLSVLTHYSSQSSSDAFTSDLHIAPHSLFCAVSLKQSAREHLTHYFVRSL